MNAVSPSHLWLCNLGTVCHKLLNLSTFEKRVTFVAFSNQQLKLIPKWTKCPKNLSESHTKHLHTKFLVNIINLFCWWQHKDERHQNLTFSLLKCDDDNPKCETPKFFLSTQSACSFVVQVSSFEVFLFHLLSDLLWSFNCSSSSMRVHSWDLKSSTPSPLWHLQSRNGWFFLDQLECCVKRHNIFASCMS